MNKKEFSNLTQSPVILDGATGSNLQKRGMPSGVCPEKWIVENREVLIGLQREYVEAGTDILYAPTFSANRIKLAEYGLENEIERLNKELVAISKEAAAGRALVAGDITMTGEQLAPMGPLEFEELIDIYKEQIGYLAEAGVDLLVIETMMSLQESRAALIAAKETCSLPVMVTMTFNEEGRTLYGTDPETAVVVLQNLGADAVGVNCSTGPDKMIAIVERMKKHAIVPIIAKPNAGIPSLDENGNTVYDMEPSEFVKNMKKIVEAGACIIGGCCGTTPEYIRALKDASEDMEPAPLNKSQGRVIASERKLLSFGLDSRFMIVGERINPTGKKKLQEELRNGEFNMVLDFAAEQEKCGAKILDINVGMNGIDEKQTMLQTIREVSSAVSLPLCIDSSHIEVVEAALRQYPGRALINSISLETEKFEKLIPIAKKYGAMFVLLPLSDKGLPKSLEEKMEIIHTILEAAIAHGMTKEDIVVDGLVATVGADKNAALDTLATIRYCRDTLGLATIIGLSNISFGLPDRSFVNSTFLTMAIKEGLTMAIANPSQEMLVKTAFAADLLMNKEEADISYINKITEMNSKEQETAASMETVQGKTVPVAENYETKIYEGVLKGSRKTIVELVKACLREGAVPGDILNKMLIPAINEVGRLFDRQIYFLPQLIASAETMKKAIEYLEPMLEETAEGEAMPVVVIATVEGDIHDIGKNLVALMLKNYGYRVIDLGKDVSKELIVKTAIENNAAVIGLSALMTTTMQEMKHVIRHAKENGCTAKVIIGGAVITQGYADEIGADGYSKDAADAVKLVQRITLTQ
ncbi:homocysteine S-methyltransferase family protein [Anaerobium acetethylicum]|uniref:Methionine synthase n=1 Tax=Anaerobium acetethylicum TaxID=1619234 RepID=A0A1D3TP64_9FIRM|nr:homocysteine S-methyltransferase family protein [Anaerobium acetethylicum]SCP95132.1 5-methyltetrahydrofolate--homocysteine methyltransferase [Anaerobium acetethylicum]